MTAIIFLWLQLTNLNAQKIITIGNWATPKIKTNATVEGQRDSKITMLTINDKTVTAITRQLLRNYAVTVYAKKWASTTS